MVVTAQDLRALVAEDGTARDRGEADRRTALQASLGSLGVPDDEVVGAALAGLESDDRNMRAAMLRVLALYPTREATGGILRGLADPARRVRELAMKAVRPHHAAAPDVIVALRSITEDEAETNRLRRTAFFVLSSVAARAELPDVARGALTALMDSSQFRLPILVRLCKMLDHTPESRALLQEFVTRGSKDEAVMATRALCGHCLVPVNAWLPAEERQRIRATYDRGPAIRGSRIGDGDSNYWIPAEDTRALLRFIGYRRVP